MGAVDEVVRRPPARPTPTAVGRYVAFISRLNQSAADSRSVAARFAVVIATVMCMKAIGEGVVAMVCV